MRYLLFVWLDLAFIFCTRTQAQSSDSLNSSEKILFNAKIFTADVRHPYAQAIGIRDKKIIAIGEFGDVKKQMHPSALLIDMKGGTLLPGLIDSHIHTVGGGETLLGANVFDSILPIQDLKKYVDESRLKKFGLAGNILIVEGINISTWSQIPELMIVFNDPSYQNAPLLLSGSDGHTAWANASLMKMAGIDLNFINTLNNDQKKYFGFLGDGQPNGFVADSGYSKIGAVIPKGAIDLKEAALKAVEYINSNGITGWLDASAGHLNNPEDQHILEAYKYLGASGKLNGHIAAVIVADADANAEKQIQLLKTIREKYKSVKNLSIIGFKIFADGVIEFPTQTAALSQPYTNSGSLGPLMFDPEKFKKFVVLADKQGFLVHVHAIGDRAVTKALDGFEAARIANGNSQIPHTISHVQIMRDADIPRFHQMGALASLQLLWALGDVTTIDIVKPYISPELYRNQYPARSLLQCGTVICGASDWPVSTANPFWAMYEAETRKGKMGVLDSSQCMPRESMLYAYTINAARAMRMEKSIGSLEPGKIADLVFLDRDVLTIDPESFKNTKVFWTMFEGKIIFRSQD